jgi:hypothetical protein
MVTMANNNGIVCIILRMMYPIIQWPFSIFRNKPDIAAMAAISGYNQFLFDRIPPNPLFQYFNWAEAPSLML